jgi:hypothetical protein
MLENLLGIRSGKPECIWKYMMILVQHRRTNDEQK